MVTRIQVAGASISDIYRVQKKEGKEKG